MVTSAFYLRVLIYTRCCTGSHCSLRIAWRGKYDFSAYVQELPRISVNEFHRIVSQLSYQNEEGHYMFQVISTTYRISTVLSSSNKSS